MAATNYFAEMSDHIFCIKTVAILGTDFLDFAFPCWQSCSRYSKLN